MRISDWSSDVCSSDLFRVMPDRLLLCHRGAEVAAGIAVAAPVGDRVAENLAAIILDPVRGLEGPARLDAAEDVEHLARGDLGDVLVADPGKHAIGRASWRERGGKYV